MPKNYKQGEQKMRKLRDIVVYVFFLSFFIIGCSESPLPEPENPAEIKTEASKVTQKVNSFIKLVMNDIYLWYNEVPDLDIRYEADSEKYFYKLLSKEDKWSFITDDAKSLEDSFEGVETSFGYSLAFGRFSNTGNIFALVEFVYPNTPASEAGIERGDIIVLKNGSDITDEDYRDLLFAPSLNITRGIRTPQGISIDSKSINMTARVLSLDPVLITDVIEHNGKKIGYLFYAQYIGGFNPSLDNAFSYFMEEGITDLVVDLRYNPGGGVDAAQHFCSSIAPASVVNSEETLVTFRWNDKYQKELERLNDVNNLKISFENNVPVKMGLNKIHFLTGSGTASASELSITGLKPYMNVTTVGETTYGKYTASNTMKPEYFYEKPDQYKDFSNWAIQPIIARFANSLGVTDFKDGFAPDIAVTDSIILGYSLGDIEEPLLKAAIEDITGSPVIARKKAKMPAPEYTLFDRGFSRYDANKRELLLDGIKLDQLYN